MTKLYELTDAVEKRGSEIVSTRFEVGKLVRKMRSSGQPKNPPYPVVNGWDEVVHALGYVTLDGEVYLVGSATGKGDARAGETLIVKYTDELEIWVNESHDRIDTEVLSDSR
jgi:hypothetical protein